MNMGKKKKEKFSSGLLPFFLHEGESHGGCNGWNTNLSRRGSKGMSRSFKMCSSPDALHLRQLKQFAAVIAAASILGKKNQRQWENCQKIRAKQMPQISKRGGL